MGMSIRRVDVVNKDDNVMLAVLAGHLYQVATDAIEKEMKKVCGAFCYDESYWKCNLTLWLSELDSNFEKLRTLSITDTDVVEHSCYRKEPSLNEINKRTLGYGS